MSIITKIERATPSKKPKRSRKNNRTLKARKAQNVSAPTPYKGGLYTASLFGLGFIGLTGAVANANAAVTIYNANGSNTIVDNVGLSQSSLGNSLLANPQNLTTGSNDYKYVAVQFTAKNSGELTLGQLSSPVDTIMIFYDGIYDKTNPGANAKVGNDDTSASIHEATLSANGYAHTGDPIKCGPSTSYCPQVKYNVTAGQTYTLFVSVYNGPSYNNNFTVPFDFYATGDVIFGQYTGRTPINTVNSFYESSQLYDGTNGDVDPLFHGGTLKIDEASKTYTHDFALSDMSTNTIDVNGHNATFSGVFSDEVANNGVISIDDTTGTGGTVTFTGANTYTGATTLKTNGTLSVSQDTNLGASSASLIFDGGTLKTTNSFDTSREINLNSTGTIDIADSTSITHSGIISGAGDLNKQGTGTLILNGNSANTGNINIDAGTMVIGSDSLLGATAQVGGNVNVGNTATLAGHGHILGHITAANGGKVAPGSPLGTLNADRLTFNTGSTYEVDAYPDGTADSITVTNNATIDPGANLSVLAGAGTWNDSTTYTIIDSGTGVTSTFDNMTTNMAFLTPTQLISGNQLLLTLTRNDTGLGDIAITENEQDTGSAIGDLGAGNPIYDTIISMDTQSANNAYNNLSGEIHGSVKSAALTNSSHIRTAVNRHLVSNGNDGAGISGTTIENGKGLWVHSWAHDGHLKSDNNAAKLDNSGWGVLVGFDAYKTDTTTLGVAAGYEQTKLKIGGTRSSDADIDSIHAMVYGRTSVGAVDIRGGVSYSKLDVEAKRNVNVGNIVSRNEADYNGDLIQVFAEGSHTIAVNDKLDVTPYAGLAYQNIRTDSFTETARDPAGNASRLHQNGSKEDVVTSTVGVRGQVNINRTSSIYADLGWQHTFGDKTPEARLNFAGGNQFTTRGAKINSNAAVIGVGANIEVKPNMNLSFGYEGAFGNESRNHAGTVRLEFSF